MNTENKEYGTLPNRYLLNDNPILEGDWYVNLLTWEVERASKNVAANWERNMSYNNGTRFLRDDIKKVSVNNPAPTPIHTGGEKEQRETFWYYWVKRLNTGFWEPAQWTGNEWVILGSDENLTDKDMEEVGSKLISHFVAKVL